MISKLNFVLLISLISVSAFAELGGTEATISADTAHFSAQRRAAVKAKAYDMHELVSRGVSVKEYVAGGKVFAVSWRGRKQPDIKQLLGSYYTEFKTASTVSAKSHFRKGRHPLVLKTNNIVFQSGGHMGSLRGFAYIQSLVPSSVQITEIQ